MLLKRSFILLMMCLFLGPIMSAQANCVEEWLAENPPLGDLTPGQISQANMISNWLQYDFPDFFAPATTPIAAGPLVFWQYTGNTIIGALQSHAFKYFYLGPLSGYCILDLGPVENLAPLLPVGEITGQIHETEYDVSQSTTSVSLSRMANTLGEFIALQHQIAVTPQGAIAMMILAMAIYQQDPILGTQCLTAASTYPLTSASTAPDSFEGRIITNISRMAENIAKQPRLPFIYYQGASPSNNYQPSGPPYILEMFTNPYSYNMASDGMRVKLFVETQGAASARPAQATKVGNIYKITEFSSLYLGHAPAR